MNKVEISIDSPHQPASARNLTFSTQKDVKLDYDSVERIDSSMKRSFMTKAYIEKQCSDVEENIKPLWVIEILGTKK